MNTVDEEAARCSVLARRGFLESKLAMNPEDKVCPLDTHDNQVEKRIRESGGQYPRRTE